MRGVNLPLRDDETLMIETRPHWSLVARPGAAAAVALAAAAAVGLLWSPDRGDDPVDLAAGIVAGLFVLRFLIALLRRRATRVVLTDRRLVTSRGLGGRAVTSIPLDRVGGVAIRRGVGGRVLGYGTIVLTPMWGEGETLLPRLPRPRRFQRILAGVLIEPPAQTQAPRRGPDPEEEDTGPLPRVIV